MKLYVCMYIEVSCLMLSQAPVTYFINKYLYGFGSLCGRGSQPLPGQWPLLYHLVKLKTTIVIIFFIWD